MKKVCEVDAMTVYQKSSVLPWDYTGGKRRAKPKWITETFSAAQINFLERHSYTIRPHPRHNPTVEVFINEQNCTEKDLTVMRLLF